MADMFRFFGGDVHVFAVCQPSVPVLAATALMEAEGDPAVPLSLILAGGPIDTRINPTVVNTLAEQRGTDWFRRNVITNVPWPNPGRGRQVYPGFLQLSGFMTMNLDRHMQAQKDMFLHLVRGDGDSAEKHREFYDEYLAVMDLTAEFYLQTVDTVFVQHLMPRGLMTSRGRPVDLGADPPRRADDGRGREGRHHRHRPVPRRARPVHQHCRRTQAALRMPAASATTAFSTARASAPRSPRASPSSCARTILAPASVAQHRAARAHGDDAAPQPAIRRSSTAWPSASPTRSEALRARLSSAATPSVACTPQDADHAQPSELRAGPTTIIC